MRSLLLSAALRPMLGGITYGQTTTSLGLLLKVEIGVRVGWTGESALCERTLGRLRPPPTLAPGGLHKRRVCECKRMVSKQRPQTLINATGRIAQSLSTLLPKLRTLSFSAQYWFSGFLALGCHPLFPPGRTRERSTSRGVAERTRASRRRSFDSAAKARRTMSGS